MYTLGEKLNNINNFVVLWNIHLFVQFGSGLALLNFHNIVWPDVYISYSKVLLAVDFVLINMAAMAYHTSLIIHQVLNKCPVFLADS